MSEPTSTSKPRKPLKPVTSAQLKALHAIGRRRGMGHEELREIAGVQESLKELSVADARRLIDRLQTSDHRHPYTPAPPARAAPGAIKMASERQRNRIAALSEILGWPDDKAAGWLLKYHAIKDLASGVFTSKAASAAITQLEQIQAKSCNLWDSDRGAVG